MPLTKEQRAKVAADGAKSDYIRNYLILAIDDFRLEEGVLHRRAIRISVGMAIHDAIAEYERLTGEKVPE